MSDYKTRTIRQIRHVEDWGWDVVCTYRRVVVRTLDGEELLDIEPKAARILAAALVSAATESEGGR